MTHPVLYIVARTDLNSMNAGKLAAQVAHAASQAARDINAIRGHIRNAIKADREPNRIQVKLVELYDDWENEGNGFGTTIVLDGGEGRHMKTMYEKISGQLFEPEEYGLGVTNLVTDDEYPLRDGTFTHLIPVDTCFWVFGAKHPEDSPVAVNYTLGTNVTSILDGLRLHK